MNYLQIFAKGGKIDTKAIKSEIARIFMLEDSPEKVEQLWQDAVNTYGSEEGVLSEIFKQVGENPSDESVQQAMMNVLNYTPMEESQMFKCGGKLQQLVTKFGKGGGVDCGCGGIKLGQEGTYLEADTPVHAAAKAARRTVSVPWPGIARRRMGAVKDNNGGLHLYEIGDINGNTAQTAVSIPAPGDTIVNQSIATTHGWNHKVLPQESLDYEMVMQRIRPFVKNGIPYKQEGGIVYTDLPGHDIDTRLTRRQARELARANRMSENNEQFSFAMANAMNAARAMGLRGAEARQRAREMVAGISPVERSIVNTPTQLSVSAPVLNTPAAITAPEQLTLPETQRLLDSMLSETNTGLIKSLNRPKQDNYQREAATRSAQAAKETANYAGYAAARDREQLASGRFVTTGDQYGISGNPMVVPILRRNRNTQPSNNETSEVVVYPKYPVSWKADRYNINGEPIYAKDTSRYYQPDGHLNPDWNSEWEVPLTPWWTRLTTLKQGGQIEKDITKTLKCGGKTKKK